MQNQHRNSMVHFVTWTPYSTLTKGSFYWLNKSVSQRHRFTPATVYVIHIRQRAHRSFTLS